MRRVAKMGSVRESSDAMAAPKAAPPVMEGVPGVAVPSSPLLPAPGTPMPNMGPGTPGIAEARGPSPSQQAATTPPGSPKEETLDVAAEPEPLVERKSKKQRIEQNEEALSRLMVMVQTTLEGLQTTQSVVSANLESQQAIQNEVSALSKQIGHDGFTSKFILSTLNEYVRVLNNLSWQMTGHKKDTNTSIKELMLHIEDYTRQISLKQHEAKQEQRSQHTSTVSAIKEVTSAIRGLEQAIRAGTEQQQPAGGGPAVPAAPAAPAVGPSMSAPPPPKAAPSAPEVPGTPVTPVAPMTSMTEGVAAPAGPGFASSAAGSAIFPPGPPIYSAPPPAAYQPPVTRAGRLRVSNRDGTLIARAVSPHGRPPASVTQDWANEYGLGTVNFSGSVYRILPDSYLAGSIPMN